MSDKSEHALARSAAIRSAIIAFLKRYPTSAFTLGEMFEDEELQPTWTEWKVEKTNTLYSVCEALVKQGQIKEGGRVGNTKTYAAIVNATKPAAVPATPKEPKRREGKHPALAVPYGAAPVRLDIVKGTGRVRLTMNGMQIEIGVVES